MDEEIYCRLCALKIEKYIRIYGEEGEKLNLATKIIQCLQIWLYPEDVLPKTVCGDCCSKINLFFDFFQTCSQSQISLMSIYKDKEIEDKNDAGSIEYSEITSENNLDHDLEDEDNNESREGSSEYAELTAPEKVTSKRKLRIPIRHSVLEGSTEESALQLSGEIIDQSEGEKKDRKCKRKTTWSFVEEEDGEGDDPDYQEDQEEEEKYTRKGLDGYVWKCITCTQELSTLAELRRHHAEVHDQAPVFACVHCPKSYTRYRSFARHVNLHSKPRRFVCDICNKSFSQKTVLQAHATVHSNDRPHTCAQCGKSFKQFSSLYLHSKVHLPEQVRQKFRCTFCMKDFSTKHTLESHLKIHTGERNYVCDICGKRFIAKGSLDYHIITHNEAKPHCCDVCGKGFKTARLLAKHSTVHTGVKPHQCDVCGKQFRERSALREHNRVHTGAMPYACEYCGKLFRFKGILTVHRRIHTGERPYRCSECRRDFTNWANYNKHVKRRHRSSDGCGGVGVRQPPPAAVPPPQLLTPPVPPPAPTSVSLPPPPPPPTQYETVDTAYKLVEDEVYRVPSYVPTVGYYMPPLQHTILQTRTQ